MNRTMIRVGGVAAVFGAIYLLLMAGFQIFASGDIDDQSLIWQAIVLMPISLLAAAAGMFVLANGRRNLQIGAAVIGLGAAIMAVGFGLMTWLDNDNGWALMFVGMILHPIGILIFGIANWRAKIFPRWNRAPLLFGITTAFLILFFPLMDQLALFTERQSEKLFAFYLVLLAVGWIALGINMFFDERNISLPSTATISLLLFFLLLAACGSGENNGEPKVTFDSPKAGESVSSPVHVVMKAENFKVEEAGEVHEGAGHFHIMIDTPCLEIGEPIPKDDNHRHFGDGSTEGDLELSSGTHTLCLQAADGAHFALEGEGMTDEISLSVP